MISGRIDHGFYSLLSFLYYFADSCSCGGLYLRTSIQTWAFDLTAIEQADGNKTHRCNSLTSKQWLNCITPFHFVYQLPSSYETKKCRQYKEEILVFNFLSNKIYFWKMAIYIPRNLKQNQLSPFFAFLSYHRFFQNFHNLLLLVIFTIWRRGKITFFILSISGVSHVFSCIFENPSRD